MNAADLLKDIGGPGSMGLLGVASGVGVLLLFWPARRLAGCVWLLVTFGSYLVLAVPAVAHAIAGGLPASPRLASPDVDGIDVLVVLDGDNRVGRLEEALGIWRASSPARIIVSGESWLVERLIEKGVTPDRITHETESGTTREQMAFVTRLMTAGRPARVAVIASRLQMGRVRALAQASGSVPILIPSPVDHEPATSGLWMFVPTYAALRISRDAVYEHLALAYYRRRGWIEAR